MRKHEAFRQIWPQAKWWIWLRLSSTCWPLSLGSFLLQPCLLSLPQLSQSSTCHPWWYSEAAKSASLLRWCVLLFYRHQNCKLKDTEAWKWPAGQGREADTPGLLEVQPFHTERKGTWSKKLGKEDGRFFPPPSASRSHVAWHSSASSWKLLCGSPLLGFSHQLPKSGCGSLDPPGPTHLYLFWGAQKSKSWVTTAHATSEWLSVQNIHWAIFFFFFLSG